MESLILTGYEFITVMLPAIAVTVILRRLYKKQNINKSRWHIIYLIIFSVYLFGVYHYTGAGTIYDAKLYGMEIKASQLNLMPFSGAEIDFAAYVLNILLFMPFGFILPLIWSDFNKYKLVFLSGASLSAMIEISQLLNNRRTDMDDLILNTIGAMLGIVLFKLFSRITKRASVRTNAYRHEMIILISVTFLCRFFTYNEFGAAKRLFGI